jgi:hypothetical protein
MKLACVAGLQTKRGSQIQIVASRERNRVICAANVLISDHKLGSA